MTATPQTHPPGWTKTISPTRDRLQSRLALCEGRAQFRRLLLDPLQRRGSGGGFHLRRLQHRLAFVRRR